MLSGKQLQYILYSAEVADRFWWFYEKFVYQKPLKTQIKTLDTVILVRVPLFAFFRIECILNLVQRLQGTF